MSTTNKYFENHLPLYRKGAETLLPLLAEKGPGFRVGRKLEKIGLRSSDTAELSFADARVPVENLVGEEGSGFVRIAMAFVTGERYLLGGALFIVANISFGASVVVYNSFLPRLAGRPPSARGQLRR